MTRGYGMSLILVFGVLFSKIGCIAATNSQSIINATAANIYGSPKTRNIEQQLLPLLQKQQDNSISESKEDEISNKIDLLIGQIKDPVDLQRLIYWQHCVIPGGGDIGLFHSALRRLFPPNSEMVYDVASLIRADAAYAELTEAVLEEDASPWSEDSKPLHSAPKSLHPDVAVYLKVSKNSRDYLDSMRPVNPQVAAVHYNLTLKIRRLADPKLSGEARFELDRNGKPYNFVGSDALKKLILACAPFGPLPAGLIRLYAKVHVE